jgi:hypothetical protein
LLKNDHANIKNQREAPPVPVMPYFCFSTVLKDRAVVKVAGDGMLYASELPDASGLPNTLGLPNTSSVSDRSSLNEPTMK